MLERLNPEIFSKFMTAAACGPNSETLTMSNEESLNNKVVDLFVRVCLIWTSDEEVMVEILKAAKYGRVQFGKDKDGSFIYKQGKT